MESNQPLEQGFSSFNKVIQLLLKDKTCLNLQEYV